MKEFVSVTEPAAYRIRISGRVDNGWSDFMKDIEQSIASENDMAITVITGIVPDQSALFGILCRVRDLRLALISVEYLPDFKKG